MLYSNDWLLACSKLKDITTQDFEAGDRIARGFADLGFEEYLLLPSDKLLSLYTSSTSKLHPAHKVHFFKVLESDDLSQYLRFKEVDFIIKTIEKGYICSIIDVEFSGNSIDEVLMKAVQYVSNS